MGKHLFDMDSEALRKKLAELKKSGEKSVTIPLNEYEHLLNRLADNAAQREREHEICERAQRYANSKLSCFLWQTDWNNPSQDALKNLREKAEELLSADIDLTEDEQQVLKAVWLEDEHADIDSAVDICMQHPCAEALSIDVSQTVSVTMTCGGPYFGVDFHLRDGELDYAETEFTDYSVTAKNRLSERAADALWQEYADSVDLAETSQASPKMW